MADGDAAVDADDGDASSVGDETNGNGPTFELSFKASQVSTKPIKPKKIILRIGLTLDISQEQIQ